MARYSSTLNNVDRIGAAISFACAVHCLALPLCLAALPLLGLSFLASEVFESVMLISAVGFATLSLCWGRRVHGQNRLFLLLALALLSFAAAHAIETDPFHALLMGIGGLVLASAHLLNRKLCRTCTACRCE